MTIQKELSYDMCVCGTQEEPRKGGRWNVRILVEERKERRREKERERRKKGGGQRCGSSLRWRKQVEKGGDK